MYRKIVLLISILLLLAFSSCVSSTPQIKRGYNNEWFLEKYKLYFADISTWQTAKDRWSVFVFNKPPQATIRIAVWDNNSPLTVDELRNAANKSLNSLKRGWSDLNIQKENDSIIGGRKAYYMKYEYKHMDSPYIGAFYITFYEGRAYQFRASVLDKFPQCMQDYDNWIKTIEFGDGFETVKFDDKKQTVFKIIKQPAEGEIELFYDDSKKDISSSPWSDKTGGEVAVRFTPPSYPVVLSKAAFFITGDGKPTTKFGVKIYKSTNAGFPGKSLLSSKVAASAVAGNEWVIVDLSEMNIVVKDGDFFISMVWLTAPQDKGKEAQFIGVDINNPSGRSYWKHTPEKDWVPIDKIGRRRDRNLMIRAILFKDK